MVPQLPAPVGGSWQAMPASFVEAVAGALDREAVLAAVAELPAGKQRRLLHPSGGVAAILSTRRPGDRVLVLGSPHLTLPTALRTFGAAVWCVDWSDARLRCAALLTEPDGTTWVRVAPGAPLPFPDRRFDDVIVDLDDLEAAVISAGSGGPSLRDALHEVVRVLAPDGTLTAATSNQVLGRRSGLRRRVRAIRSPWRGQELAGAGLRSQRVLAPLPNRKRWKWLVPLDQLDVELARRTKPKSAAQRTLSELAGRAGLTRWMLPDFFVVATRGRAGVQPLPTFVDTLDGGASTPTVASLTDARVGIIGRDRFRKLPLSPFQSDALAGEVAKVELASRTPAFGRYVVPGRTVRGPTGAVVAEYPLLVPLPGDRPDAVRTIAEILAGVPVEGRDDLAGTGLWGRLASEHGAAEAEASAAGPLRDHVLRHLGAASVPAGPTHGDLHAANLMHTDRGIVLVDWNRFEAHNPLVLDPLWSSVVHRRARNGTSLLRELAAFIDGEAAGPLHDLAVGALGDLTREQAAVLVLLDRIITYGEPRRRTRPWTLPGLRRTATALGQRLAL